MYTEGALALHEVTELKRIVEALQIELGCLKRRLEGLENGRNRENSTDVSL